MLFVSERLLMLRSVNGVQWKLYKGIVKTWIIFSFVAPSDLTTFEADLKPFFSKRYAVMKDGPS